VVHSRWAGRSHTQELSQYHGNDLDGRWWAQIQAVRLQLSTQAVPFLGGGQSSGNMIQITMLTADVAPKLKFNEESKICPRVIPMGLDRHVISSPSTQTQYLENGVQFGAGFEYQVWETFNVGLDGWFHLVSNQRRIIRDRVHWYNHGGPHCAMGYRSSAQYWAEQSTQVA